MKKSNFSTAQQMQSLLPKLVFDTVAGFAAKGITFDGPYKVESNYVLVKAINFPGGTKLGYHALSMFLTEAAMLTLMFCCDKLSENACEDMEDTAYTEQLYGISIHALYIAEMIDGNNKKDAINSIIKRLHEVGISITKKNVENTLSFEMIEV